MPSRKRTNLSRSTADARRKRVIRASESKSQRENRLRTQRERTSCARAAETEEQRELRRESDRRRKARFMTAQREQSRTADRKRRLAQLQDSEQGDPDPAAGMERKSRGKSKLEASARHKRRLVSARKGQALQRDDETQPRRARRPGADLKRHSRGGGQRSVGDPEVFIKRAVKQWIDKVKRQVYVACSRANIKTEVIEEDEMILSDNPVQDIVPKVEPEEDLTNRSKRKGRSRAKGRPVLNPVEVFVTVPDSPSRAPSVPEDSDPLGGYGDSKLSALITIADDGVLREESYSTAVSGSRNANVLRRVKLEAPGSESSSTPAKDASPITGSSDVLEKD